jgi:predicted permease
VFRLLLCFFPAPFRARHEAAMLATLVEAWRDRGRSVAGRVRFWFGTVGEMVAQGLAERVRPAPVTPRGGGAKGASGRGGSFERWAMDLRTAARALGRSPGFAAIVSLTLALGIGANVAIFSLVDAVVLRPLPVDEPQGLVEVFEALNARSVRGGLSYATYRELARASSGTSGMAAFGGQEAELRFTDRAVIVEVGLVSGSYFPVLGVRAHRGRLLAPEDEAGWGASPVAVVSYDLWRTELGADEHAVGRALDLRGRSFTVVGVAPPGFRGVHLTSGTDVWVPVTMGGAVAGEDGLYGVPDVLTTPVAHVFDVVARLERGVSPDEAAARLNQARKALPHPVAEDVDEPMSVLPVRAAAAAVDRDDLVRFLGLLGGVVGLTLLMACVNVANLLVVRARRRARDLAVRSALGAGRGRLFRQLGLEALLLGLAGGGLSLGTARAGVALLSGFTLPGGVPVDRAGLRLGLEASLLAGGLGLVAAVLFGAVPAWRASGPKALGGLRVREGARGGRAGWGLLLAAQSGLSVVLLVGAALFGRTLQEALRTDLGFRPDSVAALSVRLRPHGATGEEAVRLVEAVLDQTRARPGITGAAFATHVPVSARTLALPFLPEGGERVPGGMSINVVTAGYFDLLGIPLLSGRTFDARDRGDGPRVIIVNEAAAELLWPGENPLGRGARIVFHERPSTVVGVVGQTLYHDLSDRDQAYVYYPLSQLAGPAASRASFLARSSGGSTRALEALRNSVDEVAPLLPTYAGRSVSDQLDTVLATQRFGAALLGLFSGLALVIAAVGVYGVASWAVAARRREIGIRRALGARTPRLLAGVLGAAAGAIVAGTAFGVLAALLLAGLLEVFLVGVAPLDGVAFGAALGALGLAALVAVALPARRAVAVDPAETMRAE